MQQQVVMLMLGLMVALSHFAVGFSPLKDDILYNINWHQSGTQLADLELPGQQLDPHSSYLMSTGTSLLEQEFVLFCAYIPSLIFEVSLNTSTV